MSIRSMTVAMVGAAMVLPAVGPRAQTPTPILIDINTGNGPIVGSDPRNVARINATQTIFSAYDPVHGIEPWITDGTAANTHVLADICPGACSSNPVALNSADAAARGVLYLSADDGVHGSELWKVTGAGVVSLVKDINPGALGSNPFTGDSPMAFLGSAASSPGFFSATTAADGRELWKTDGTPAGTVLVKDINPGTASSSPNSFSAGLNHVYFSASTPDTGRELYVTDGSELGTMLRLDIQPGSGSSNPGQIVEFLNDTMIFTADDGTHGRELWQTTPTTTVLLKDLVPGSDGSSPDEITPFVANGGGYLFSAYSGSANSNRELWISNGTAGGTLPFKDLCPGSCSSNPRRFTTLNSGQAQRVLFYAQPNGSGNPSLYASDGTAVGTIPIFATGVALPSFLVVSGLLAYFDDSQDLKLYRTDGTALGTILVHDFSDENFLTVTQFGLAPVGANKILIGADDGFDGNEPYVVGPNAAVGSPTRLRNIAPDLGYSDPQELTAVGTTLFFTAFSETTGRELWKVSDPLVGAELVTDIVPGAIGSNPVDLTEFNGKLYFDAGIPGIAQELFVSDGSVAGTHQLKNFGQGDLLDYSNCLSIAGGHLYFNATTFGGVPNGPWISDGTDAGTQPIDASRSFHSFCNRKEAGFAVAGNNVLFAADDSIHGTELFRTNGTPAGTTLVRDIAPGADDSEPLQFVSLGDRACFYAEQGGNFGHDSEPWCSDGTAQGTLPLGDLNPGSGNSDPRSLTAIGNTLVFSALSPTLGRRIWRSDGTSDDTIAFPLPAPGKSVVGFPAPIQAEEIEPPPLEHDGKVIYYPCTDASALLCLQDIRPGRESSGAGIFGIAGGGVAAFDQLHVFPGGDMLMSCWTAAKGRELCRFNSAFNGTTIQPIDTSIVDIATGPESSSPDQITPAGDFIYFTADDGAHGRELWAIALKQTLDRIFHEEFE